MIGILGAGQLGRMLALAGYPLGKRFRVFDPVSDSPASDVAEHVKCDFSDKAALDAFACGLEVITYEFENVPVDAARHLAASVPVYPPPSALDIAQDRLAEKTMFRELGIDTPTFLPVDNFDELHSAIETVGLPAVLKTRRLGYDGKGQYVIHSPSDVPDAWQSLGGAGLILESFVTFDRELSIVAVRGRDGECRCYPITENQHRVGILRVSTVPAPDLSPATMTQAEEIAGRVMDRLEYVGVIAVELFDLGGALMANELAPRVHNSGHWTIEGAETSQFENHLRAVLGLPIGSTSLVAPSVMLNLIGVIPESERILALPGTHLHLYGKEPRPGRKVGHVTVRQTEQSPLDTVVNQVKAIIEEAESTQS